MAEAVIIDLVKFIGGRRKDRQIHRETHGHTQTDTHTHTGTHTQTHTHTHTTAPALCVSHEVFGFSLSRSSANVETWRKNDLGKKKKKCFRWGSNPGPSAC